jgi:hypothetical protein
MSVLIPPTVAAVPAILTRFAQLRARMVGLTALASMMLDGFMKAMIRFGNAPLAIVVICAQTRGATEEQESGQRSACQHGLSGPENSRLQFCLHPVLLYF